MGKKKNFPHILNASSTLLGLCFVVLTSLKLGDNHETSRIDEFTAIAILMFMTSSILSYLSMRSERLAARYERKADITFLSGLIVLFITTLLITLNVIK
ncbi:hypothetical protein [Flavobacterium sp.]|uniref:hypothetical protein n=1 Tax=Flavobacterium sp. TaxID=239 RepID=UPI0039E58D49